MRTAMWLSIFVFISTLFWPQLLDKHLVLLALVLSFLLLLIPQLRILAIIPITGLYFTFYACLTLTGQLISLPLLDNKDGLEMLVDNKDHTIIVQVVSLISKNNQGYFSAKFIEVDGDHLNYRPLVEMRWFKPKVILQAGQKHRFIVRLKPIWGRANPTGFDRQKWSYSEHIGYRASIKKHIGLIDEKLTVRASFYQQVQLITESLTHQGLLLALSFADKSLIPIEVKWRIRDLGISHLFAISGLHIGLFFSAVFMFFQLFFKFLLPASKMGWFSFRLINFSALVGAFGYAYLAGFSFPTQRAFLMLLIAVFIFSLKRKCSKIDLLSLVLFLVLVWDPLAVLSLSLWLSFTAVAIILVLIWAYPVTVKNQPQELVNSRGYTLKIKLIGYIKLLFFLQIGLTVLMLPVQLIGFSGLSLVSIIINLFAIPLFSLFIIPLVLLSSFLTLLYPPLALLLFIFCDQAISLFFVFSGFLSDNYFWFSSAQEKLLLIIFLIITLIFLLHFQGWDQRKMSYLFSVTLVGGLFLFPTTVKDEWFVEVIDVGQGLSVLVRSEDKTLLYDTGARYPSGFNMANREIVPYLISLGVKKIDHLVISHSDIDHSGGADVIAEKFIVSERWAGEPLQSLYKFNSCKQGQFWTLGKLKVEVLSPVFLTKNNNDNSCVLRITDGDRAVLLTGDIGKKQEKALVYSLNEKLNSDILIAPHHGSRYSSSEIFISAVAPQWVVFSAGFMNQWGFPTQEAKKRYKKQGVKMVNSGLSGLIRFQITPQAIKIQTFREDLAAYWYHHSLISSPLDWIHR